jgi:acetate---CoA ligase (ADP-forming)
MSLDALLRPRSIAIVGASATPTRIGGIPIKLLTEAGFEKFFPINPKYQQIAGRHCYPDIESVPEPVDLALLAISMEETLPYLERCHAAGVKAALVFAAGFAETNKPEGMAQQQKLAAFAQRTGMRVAGPNCMGNANYLDRVFTTFGTSFPPGDPAGNTALLTQSGNLSATLFRAARRHGVSFSHVINTGNEANVDFADYLSFLADDPHTQVILGYIEELRNGDRFLRAAAACRAKGKLLAVYKVGASEKGAEAARSHTAALAGNEAAYDAAFAAAGVVRATDIASLSDLAYLHAFGGRMAGNGCAILSVSGAAGAILADALTLNGASVPTLSPDIQAGLRARIPDFGMVTNPVDLTGNLVNTNDFLLEAIRLVLRPDEIDALIVYLPGYFLDRALDQLTRAAAESTKTIVVIDTFALGDRERLRQAGLAYFDDFDRAARAIASYGAWKRRGPQAAPVTPPAVTAWPALPADQTALSETQAKQILARFGVPVVTDLTVHSALDARRAAEQLGYPVVLKLVSADVAHKTEHGLIRLQLRTADAVEDAYNDLLVKAAALPAVRVEGITVEPMLAGGVEILAGVTRDPVFGWMLTVGLGGVWTELMRDVRHQLLPVSAEQAHSLLRQLKGFALLDGYRGAPKADVPAAAQAIAAVCNAVLAGGERLREVEINPLWVMPLGQGAVAVDALILLTSPTTDRKECAA